ncbi:hypothetical protein U1Q18_033816 [Sarracenia purpurea var. burkii]
MTGREEVRKPRYTLLQPVAAAPPRLVAPPLSWSPLIRSSRSSVDLMRESSAKIGSTITAADLSSIDPRTSRLASNQLSPHHLVPLHCRDGSHRFLRGLDLILRRA